MSAPGPSDDGVDPFTWNEVALQAGARLLARWVSVEPVPSHVVDLWTQALAAVGSARDLCTVDGHRLVLTLAATVHPFGLGQRPEVHDALQRVFTWGVRRPMRDRRVRDSLSDVLDAVTAAHAALAELAGEPVAPAVDAERLAQAADIARVRADAGSAPR